ncbi:MAG: hypothetical protein DRP11_05185 [Candidatus Aenigmatarchaeota archaeon]|nr:MAG: hypothetical protein DRP11_05185 [Candidatus Aenigmarchaeota archaeon]
MSRIPKESIYILRKLYTWNRIGNKYINVHYVFRAFPKRLRNKKLFKEWVNELVKLELVLLHKNGECISLNKHKLGEIESLIYS